MYYITLSEWTIGFKSNPATNERHLRPLKLYAFSITLMRSGNFIDRNYREAVDSNSQRHRWFKLPICCRLRWLDRNFLLLLSLLICDNKLSHRLAFEGKCASSWLENDLAGPKQKAKLWNAIWEIFAIGCAAIKLPTARLQKNKADPQTNRNETDWTEINWNERPQ